MPNRPSGTMVRPSSTAVGLSLAMLLFSLGSPILAQDNPISRATAIDGDTINLHSEPITLNGIDAPETDQTCADSAGATYACGQRASQVLAKKIADYPVHCDQFEHDPDAGKVAHCSAGGEDLGGYMVTTGWAVANTLKTLEYLRAEQWAKKAKYGMWQGNFVMPWNWREGERLE